MTIDELKQSGRIIFECISGSHAYGLNVPTSDFDIRGLYINPSTEYLGLKEPELQIQDDKHDVVYYSLKRIFELLQTANPNCIEILWIPEDCVKIKTKQMQLLLDNRHIFITKKAYYTHAAYATAQIGRAKGCNKRVHNPQPETMPSKEDFCWVIDMNVIDHQTQTYKNIIHIAMESAGFDNPRLEPMSKGFPFRPVPLKESLINLSHIHLSSLEHVPDVYRMYYYGEGAKGVFRGDQMLCCESIPKDDEITKFMGLLIYNKNEYEKAVKEWHQYWDWMKSRNQFRWTDQEKGLLTYDQKNMCHCMRLILSCENILKNEYPIVRFDGENREYLMKIRKGEFTYEEIMEKVEEKKIVLEELLNKSTLPENVNFEDVNKIYRKISNIGE